jgi:hypothetical protein
VEMKFKKFFYYEQFRDEWPEPAYRKEEWEFMDGIIKKVPDLFGSLFCEFFSKK